MHFASKLGSMTSGGTAEMEKYRERNQCIIDYPGRGWRLAADCGCSLRMEPETADWGGTDRHPPAATSSTGDHSDAQVSSDYIPYYYLT